MARTPPALAWLPGFSYSLGGALNCSVASSVEPTTNPLIHKIRFVFGEALSGKQLMMVWNLFQKYAHSNECLPQGKLEGWGKEVVISVGMKRRGGFPMDQHPAG